MRREFWEHKGGFVWAPVITAASRSLSRSWPRIAGTILGQKHGVHVNATKMPPKSTRDHRARSETAHCWAASAWRWPCWPSWCSSTRLGSLYDDRRDRSILFWKSMPVSDTQMVLSKAAWALVMAPLVALVIGLPSAWCLGDHHAHLDRQRHCRASAASSSLASVPDHRPVLLAAAGAGVVVAARRGLADAVLRLVAPRALPVGGDAADPCAAR